MKETTELREGMERLKAENVQLKETAAADIGKCSVIAGKIGPSNDLTSFSGISRSRQH
jgi:hypothetical protein